MQFVFGSLASIEWILPVVIAAQLLDSEIEIENGASTIHSVACTFTHFHSPDATAESRQTHTRAQREILIYFTVR